jgi:hypothetical protein
LNRNSALSQFDWSNHSRIFRREAARLEVAEATLDKEAQDELLRLADVFVEEAAKQQQQPQQKESC